MHARTHPRVVLVISAQSGKTESFLDIIGERMDTSPVPTIYIGPSEKFVKQQFEPRIVELFETTPALKPKVMKGKRVSKTQKFISGVPFRMAHGGSSTALKSDPFGLALTDEADEMMKGVRGMGSPIELVDSRGDSYADFVHAIVSTPSDGVADVAVDEESGLEFWDTDLEIEIKSTIWQLWRGGTQYHWAMPCPHCGEYFIPRFRNLKWDKPIHPVTGKEMSSTTEMAYETAYLQCPQGCAERIVESHKRDMLDRGVYVAPGQHVELDGTVVGSPKNDSRTLSFWVSGLASPFVTWNARAERYVRAVQTGDSEVTRANINGGFAELYTPGGGQVPAWKEVAALRVDYEMGQVPSGVQMLTMAVDVQKNGLYFTIRGWGQRASSWLIKAGFLQGETHEEYIWGVLELLSQETYNGIPLSLAVIDSGFRPGKKFELPINRIYEFCRRNKRLFRPTKGSSTVMIRPIIASDIDVNHKGVILHKALTLYRLDTDVWKRWVHERIRWDLEQPGGWHLPNDISDDYCMQMVSEARVVLPNGKVKWVQRAKDNHYFDCEAMQAAAGSMINALYLPSLDELEAAQRPRTATRHVEEEREARTGTGSWLGNEGSIW